MNYVLTGGAGHITHSLAAQLLAAGHEVTVIGRNESNLQELLSQGAKAAIGSVEDVSFLINAFKGADAVYTMVPPYFAATDWKAWIGGIGRNYAEAIAEAGVKYVVNLSSIGAHLPDGAGPISGLHRVEQALNKLEGVHILHLRPAFFHINLLANIPLIKQANIIGSNYGGDETKIVLVHPLDIADVAAAALLSKDFTGHSVRYIASDEKTTSQIAATLGKAIQKPELPWVTFTDEQNKEGLLGAGLPQEIAENYTQMGAGMRQGILTEDYWKHHPGLSKRNLESFAPEFAAAYSAS